MRFLLSTGWCSYSFFGWLLFAGPIACFDASSPPPTERTCEDNCDRQVSAGCANTTVDLAATCKQACIAYRVNYPDCASEMNRMSGCVNDKVKFSCDSSGTLVATPIAVCSDEEYACYHCTGDFAPCRN